MLAPKDKPRDYRLAVTWFARPTLALGFCSWLAYERSLLGLLSLVASLVAVVWGAAGIAWVLTRPALPAWAKLGLAAVCLAGVGLGLGRIYYLALLPQVSSPGT